VIPRDDIQPGMRGIITMKINTIFLDLKNCCNNMHYFILLQQFLFQYLGKNAQFKQKCATIFVVFSHIASDLVFPIPILPIMIFRNPFFI